MLKFYYGTLGSCPISELDPGGKKPGLLMLRFNFLFIILGIPPPASTRAGFNYAGVTAEFI